MAGLAGCRTFSAFRLDALDLLARALMAHLHLLKSSADLFRRSGSIEVRVAGHSDEEKRRPALAGRDCLWPGS